MALENQHPEYGEHIADWELMTDSHRGERVVKKAAFKYLPATPGQLLDGMGQGQEGLKNYEAYKLRARFPDFIKSAVEALIGIMHHKPATVELPDKMQPMIEEATNKGESLQMLLRRVNEAQLTTGRIGLLADIPNDAPAGVLPYIATYKEKDVVNWDDEEIDEQARRTLNMVVLDESKFVREDFTWTKKTKYRVLLLKDGVYQMGVFEGDQSQFAESRLMTPSVAGRTLEKLPFVIVNATDIVADPDDPPLLGLANLGMTVYRGEADYRQTLFMQGQDTLVVIGGTEDDEVRAGAGARINVMQGGDAKYIGIDAKGLKEMREALVLDRKEAAEQSGKLLDTHGKEAESGEALRIRVSARTASLNQIAHAGAEGVETTLRRIAVWIGADPEKVKVTPNLDFADDTLDGDTLVKYMSAKTLGLPWSNRSIHKKLQEKDLTELEYEEEIEEIQNEEPLIAPAEEGLGEEDDKDADADKNQLRDEED